MNVLRPYATTQPSRSVIRASNDIILIAPRLERYDRTLRALVSFALDGIVIVLNLQIAPRP